MTPFRLCWELHKWTGIALGAILLVTGATGVLLLVKKDFAWIQPPTQDGTPGPAERIAPMHEVYDAVFALGLPQLRDEGDIDRIDFRPGRRVFKVRSKHDNVEVQVDAIELRTWGPATRNSDWLERIHDGQWLGGWAHGWLMPATGLGVVILVCSGYLVWLWPILVKRRARIRAQTKAHS